MLDKKTELMLQAASTLTAEDLDHLRGAAPVEKTKAEPAAAKLSEPTMPDRKSTRLNSSHIPLSRMPSSA